MTATTEAPTEALTEAQTITIAKTTSKRLRVLKEQIARRRVNRNHAMVALTRPPHGWPKLRVVKLVGVTRTMFHDVIAAAPAELPKIKGNPETVAVREHEAVKAIETEMVALREARDEAITSLLYDFHLPNNKVAALTGELQVRIAQLRQRALA